jgi:cytosine/adenosine deaminase-related metal-dependent hydrolase
MQMRQGYPSVQKALDFGIQPSLSSDVSSNMSADPFTLMRAAYLAQRAEINNRVNAGEVNAPPLLTSRQPIEFAAINGAKAMQLDAKVGSLTPGKEADIVMLATDRINVFPVNNVPGAIVTQMDTSNVDAVFIAGDVKKWQGQLVGVDMNQLKRSIEQSRDRAFERNKYQPKLFDTCCAGPELPDASAP